MPHPETDRPTPEPPVLLVLHGARGDLARRLVLPAVAELAAAGLLPDRWTVLGTGRRDASDDDFAELARDALSEFGPEDVDGGVFDGHLHYARSFTEDDPGELVDAIARETEALRDGGTEPTVVHYLAVPPSAFGPTTRGLRAHGLTDGIRVVYEKPYGTSSESFEELDALVHEVLDEDQVFRIDHFLGKEATQNLHVLRSGNELFSGVWNARHVAEVQIDLPETLDVADRADFYDATGAALDMLVTHLFQVAAEVAMEPPARFDAAHLAEARERMIGCFRPLDPVEDVVLGQFEGYRGIDGVADDSSTDTFVAARLWVDNDRWRGVPFLLRTGKRMARSAQQVTLVLRTPEQLFGEPNGPGRIALSLAGDGAIEVTTTVKRPGPDLRLGTGTASLALEDVDGGRPVSAYGSLLHDVLVGDRSLFTTPEGLRAAWRAFAPLQGPDRPAPEPYRPGSWGPAAADRLTGPDGWVLGDQD
ncbi:glucose-6-phosphate dehydrogenase [Cellulomonas denverensis]|uniref:glucose-6-phosphate dehydrogenase n=1 Tax=Cellulomonas denverensis TaxID=264297 RepID=UPI0019458F21|nr:glucose-6-phosphate dehydrogenase [Cellulomonas denverensis]GIG24954.1 glucose-6-phosphate 1-dehydrogenase [Cellulomonas denverensis]